MNITERENELFARWSQKYEGCADSFIKDGVPCPESFEKASCKITFVLKDPNDFQGSNMDMRRWVCEYGGRPLTWDNVTRWTQAILEGGDFPQKISLDDRFRWLRQISFMNLKKLNGLSSAYSPAIKSYAKNDAEFIFEQLNIYQPDIIVCCGKNLVFDCLADYVFSHDDDWEYNTEAFYVQLPGKTNKTVALNCYHPQHRMKHEDLFCALTESLRKNVRKV